MKIRTKFILLAFLAILFLGSAIFVGFNKLFRKVSSNEPGTYYISYKDAFHDNAWGADLYTRKRILLEKIGKSYRIYEENPQVILLYPGKEPEYQYATEQPVYRYYPQRNWLERYSTSTAE